MFAKAVSALIGLFFGSVAFLLTWDKIDQFIESPALWVQITASIVIAVIFLVIGTLVATPFARSVKRLTNYWADRLSKMPVSRIVGGVVGLITGLIIAILINTVLSQIYLIGPYLSVLTILVLGYMGLYVGARRTEDFTAVTERLRQRNERALKNDERLLIVRGRRAPALISAIILRSWIPA